jgi:uncharacterized protein (TIGR00730 family)
MLHRLKEYARFLKSLASINLRLLWGMWKLTRLPQPAITIFGSARLSMDSKDSARAQTLARKLAFDGFSIITGGGPGIMKAANKGAFEAMQDLGFKNKIQRKQINSFGVGLTRLSTEKRTNKYMHDIIIMDHFFSRKWLLVRYSVGFIAFPGGFGTLDELFEVVTLVQCERMKKMPIILIGKDFWKPLEEHIYRRMLANGLISDDDVGIITAITDDLDEAYEIIRTHCKKNGTGKKGCEDDEKESAN